jgi:hypothetical protein
MYSGALAGTDNLRHQHSTHPAARASPPPGSTAEKHRCPGLAAGRPEAIAAAPPCLHRCCSATGRGINPSFSSRSDWSVGMCDVLISSSLCMNWFLIYWHVNSLGRVVVICGYLCLTDKQKYSTLCCCEICKLCLDIYLYVWNILQWSWLDQRICMKCSTVELVGVCLPEFNFLLHSDPIPTCVDHFILSVNRSLNFELLLISC